MSVSNNNKSIHILRGDQNYNPSSINTILDDGQPFYSKKNQQLYIGDDTKKDLTSPVGAANLIPGSKGACNVIQLNTIDRNAATTAKRCTHNGAAVFGFNTRSTNANQFIAGRYNKTDASNNIFVVGDGTSDADNDRHNAIEVKDNQSTYINTSISLGDASNAPIALKTYSSYDSDDVKTLESPHRLAAKDLVLKDTTTTNLLFYAGTNTNKNGYYYQFLNNEAIINNPLTINNKLDIITNGTIDNVFNVDNKLIVNKQDNGQDVYVSSIKSGGLIKGDGGLEITKGVVNINPTGGAVNIKPTDNNNVEIIPSGYIRLKTWGTSPSPSNSDLMPEFLPLMLCDYGEGETITSGKKSGVLYDSNALYLAGNGSYVRIPKALKVEGDVTLTGVGTTTQSTNYNPLFLDSNSKLCKTNTITFNGSTANVPGTFYVGQIPQGNKTPNGVKLQVFGKATVSAAPDISKNSNDVVRGNEIAELNYSNSTENITGFKTLKYINQVDGRITKCEMQDIVVNINTSGDTISLSHLIFATLE